MVTVVRSFRVLKLKNLTTLFRLRLVSSLIDKELPNLIKLYEPVGELQAAYQQAMDAYNSFIATWVGRLPESDTNGRALELALTEVERALR